MMLQKSSTPTPLIVRNEERKKVTEKVSGTVKFVVIGIIRV